MYTKVSSCFSQFDENIFKVFILKFNAAFTTAFVIVENIEFRSKMKAFHMKRKMILTFL